VRAGLSVFDLAIVSTYLAGIVGLSLSVARRQTTGEDYFLGGRRLGGLTLALSILANQASAVSLIGAPAFVALRVGGGLRWLQYELAVPLAMIGVAMLLPALRSVPGSSIYAYAEARFGPGTRRALAAAFLLSRGLSLGILLYASALVAAHALGWPVTAALVGIGLFAVAYTSLGGIVADIWSDVAQLVVLWGGTLVAAAYLLARGGFALLRAIPHERTQALVVGSAGFSPGGEFSLLPMLFGGFFLYMSYYGCDQTQAQRLLSARSTEAARRALVLNGLLRFPLVATYCGLGLLLAGLLQVDPRFASLVAGQAPDSLVPTFLMHYLPSGVRGLMFAALLAAAMSSIDSTLNSLAAITLEDVCGQLPPAQGVWTSRGVSLLWGVFGIGAGLLFARSGTGLLELVNKVGSAFYGPVLAVFVVGVVFPRVPGHAALSGLCGGLVGNLLLGSLVPQVSWLWWNPFGFTVAVAAALALATRPFDGVWWPPLPREGGLLVGAFALMMALLALVSLGAG
jgi:SSS family transporter